MIWSPSSSSAPSTLTGGGRISSSTSSSSGKAKRIACSGAQAGSSRGRASVVLATNGAVVAIRVAFRYVSIHHEWLNRDYISTQAPPPPHQLPPADIRVIEAKQQRFAEQDEKQVEKGNKEVLLVWVCNSEEEEENQGWHESDETGMKGTEMTLHGSLSLTHTHFDTQLENENEIFRLAAEGKEVLLEY
ncbi:hypothetical protein TorRG33x02_015690 [Trema orientale]|uniref:Uncharacterized protein n=1 Tax=Trema orientale TaxID=63057 RepID=A0A2P5FXS8_TREOI|nr:hypothetical protein TorRG33x02_015690 [Trema orientale]